MFDAEKWQEIFSSMKRHKLRTFLTALSVWWGIFMLVILLGSGNGLQNSAKEGFEEDAVNTLWIWTEQTSEPYKGLPAGRWINFDNTDYDEIDRLETTRYTSGRYRLWGEYTISYKDKSLSYDIQCVHPEHLHIEKLKMVQGRFFNDKDIKEYRKVCAIGLKVAEGFFKEEEALGKMIKIKGVEYKVVGVFEDVRDREMERIYLPVSTTQRVEGTDRLHTITVELGEATFEESQQIETDIRQAMAVKHKFAPTDKKAIGIYNGLQEYKEIKMLFSFINIFIWFVGIGSIIAGVIGVSNIMLIIVKERTKEIGIRKALGATPGSIISMIVQEAVFLTSVAGYLGLASGLAVIYAIQQFMEANNIEAEFFVNPEVKLSTVLAALFILVLSGVIAGLIPAIQAVKVNPVVAMKS
ncbi:MAG: ABC transporter permease [Bacteroidota bacterium]